MLHRTSVLIHIPHHKRAMQLLVLHHCPVRVWRAVDLLTSGYSSLSETAITPRLSPSGTCISLETVTIHYSHTRVTIYKLPWLQNYWYLSDVENQLNQMRQATTSHIPQMKNHPLLGKSQVQVSFTASHVLSDECNKPEWHFTTLPPVLQLGCYSSYCYWVCGASKHKQNQAETHVFTDEFMTNDELWGCFGHRGSVLTSPHLHSHTFQRHHKTSIRN